MRTSSLARSCGSKSAPHRSSVMSSRPSGLATGRFQGRRLSCIGGCEEANHGNDRPHGRWRPPRRGSVRTWVGSVAIASRGDADARRRPARAPAPDRAPGCRRRRGRALRLPFRSVAATRRHLAELPPDRLRLDGCGPRRDPSTQRDAPGHHWRRVRGAGPCSCVVGPRDADRLDDRRQPRLAWAAGPRPGGPFLCGDATDRSGVRGAGVDAAERSRRVRGLRRDDARAGWTGPGRTDGTGPGERDPPSATPRASGPAPDPGRDLRLDDVAVDRPPAGRGQGRVRLPVGGARAGGHPLARGRLASLEPAGPGHDPPDAAGPRRGPADREQNGTAGRIAGPVPSPDVDPDVSNDAPTVGLCLRHTHRRPRRHP